MRISDWSSDVCSSDLAQRCGLPSLTELCRPLMVCRHAREALGPPPALRTPALAGPCSPLPIGLKACPRQPATPGSPLRSRTTSCRLDQAGLSPAQQAPLRLALAHTWTR